MKLECSADRRAWAEVKDVWTRKDMRRFLEIMASTNGTMPDLLADYLRDCVKDVCLVSLAGDEFRGVDAVLDLDFDEVEFDAAVEFFWGSLPRLAFEQRQRLGEAIRVG